MNNISRFTLFYFIGLILFLGSCTKMDDLYKGAENQESTLFDGDVVLPEAFNWESSKAVDVHIAVDDNYNGKYFYRVELYDADPKLTSANILGAGVAKLGQDYTDKIMVPTAAKYVYVKTTSPVGIAAISMIEVGNKTTVSLNRAASGTRANKMVATLASSTTGGSGGTIGFSSITTSSAPSVPSNAIELHDNSPYVTDFWNNQPPNGTSFVVKAGTTLTHAFYLNTELSGFKVYVEGTWDTGYLAIGKNNKIYVMPGGVFKVNQLAQNAQAAFENYGSAEIQTMELLNPATYKNGGVINIKNATIASGGSFYNYGSAFIENLSTQSSGTVVRNEGSMTVDYAEITNASAVEASCHTIFNTLKATGAVFSVFENALLEVGNLDAGGTTFNLASSSILDVTTLAKFNSNSSKIQGTGSSDAVARLKKVDVSGQWNAIIYSGNLEVACSDHTANEQHSTRYTITSPARLVNYDQSTVVIAATDCNAGGNNDAGAGTDPDDQTAPEVSLGTYSYAFEDNWPSFGDYDMNDFVVDMEITKFQNTENKVTKVSLKTKLRSVGAAKRLAAAIQLDDVLANNVKAVTYSNSDIVGNNFQLSSNGTESGQTYAVLPITSDAHKAFGLSEVEFISTKNGKFAPVEVTITTEFNVPLDNFTYENLNVFIINFMQNQAGRNEVHLAGYSATDKINVSLVNAEVNSGLLFSAAQPFKSKKGYPWAISVPVSFNYPDEWKNIKNVFVNFSSWAISGGELHQDWYMN